MLPDRNWLHLQANRVEKLAKLDSRNVLSLEMGKSSGYYASAESHDIAIRILPSWNYLSAGLSPNWQVDCMFITCSFFVVLSELA